jgi:large subunit ribosomal protein L3
MNGILGRKIGMTRVFGEGNAVIPVTVIEAGPCVVTQVKTKERDGYQAVQMGFSQKKDSKTTKAMKGHFAKAGTPSQRHIREFKVADAGQYKAGQVIKTDIFAAGDAVKVTGTMKGRGTAGVVKRHGFRGGPGSHGQTDRLRRPGSAGSGTTPGRVYPGHRYAGQMGNVPVTVRNLKVVKVDAEKNLLLVRGAVPGAADGILLVQKITKRA